MFSKPDSWLTRVEKERWQWRRKTLLLMLLTALIALPAGYYARVWYARAIVDPNALELASRQRALDAVRHRLAELEGQLVTQRERQEVDTQALRLLQQTMLGYKEQVSDLEEAVDFYRGLMDPGGSSDGVSIRDVEVIRTRAADRYRLRVVVQQVARRHDVLRGRLAIALDGSVDGESTVIPVTDLETSLEGERLKLQFRYFQTLEGFVVVPGNFDVKRILVKLHLSSPKKLELERQLAWQVKERLTMLGSRKGGDSSAMAGTTLISAEATATGDIAFSGNLDIEGTVRGNIQALDGPDAMVRVVGNGRVEGNISAPTVVINATVVGNIHAGKHLELAAQGVVEGSVYYVQVEMAVGASVNGSLARIEPGASPLEMALPGPEFAVKELQGPGFGGGPDGP